MSKSSKCWKIPTWAMKKKIVLTESDKKKLNRMLKKGSREYDKKYGK